MQVSGSIVDRALPEPLPPDSHPAGRSASGFDQYGVCQCQLVSSVHLVVYMYIHSIYYAMYMYS